VCKVELGESEDFSPGSIFSFGLAQKLYIHYQKGGPMTDREVTRREFMRNAGRTALAAAVAVPFMNLESSASSGKPPLPMQPIDMDLTKQEFEPLAKVGGAVKIPNPHDAHKPIIVTRTSETEVAAFSSKCTHFGCEVPLPDNDVITCQCHGSKFDVGGKVIHGPANKPLKAFAATLSGTTITIKDIEA
jgi:Rieske Fe-S protein